MNKPVHPFDPALIKLFSQSVTNKPIAKENNPINSRHLFYQLNQAEQYPDILPCAHAFISKKLKIVKTSYSSSFIANYSEEKLVSLQTPSIAPVENQLQTQDNLKFCINQTAAILLTQPYWLQNISRTAFSHTEASIQLISLYLQLTRTEQQHDVLLEFYRSLLLANGIKIPILHSYSYSQQADIFSAFFDFATLQLALARFPRVLLAEILGFTLAYCQMPTLIDVCFPNHQLQSNYFKLRHEKVEQQIPALLQCITNYLTLFPRQKSQLWLRIQTGFWLYHQQMQYCRDKINDALINRLSPQQAVASLFNKKAMAAIGHHQKIKLDGISLDKWFSEMPANSQAFLHALKKSGYVDRQKPEQSPLLSLFNFKGPMFGILNQHECEILKTWLKDESAETSLHHIDQSEPVAKVVVPLPPSIAFQSTQKYGHLNNRELYYYLINADFFPDVLSFAKNKTNKLLKLTRLFNRLPFKHYTHEQFDNYIENLYQHEIRVYQPLQGKPKFSRAAYVWGIEQIAPMILIDGCWIQNSLMLQNINPEICDILFSIYCDEIGNGKLEQNHPYIFQQLLDSLSIQLPPVYSKDFVNHSDFIDSAFDLPVYMLALSCTPAEFLPELLGLNMAIELSGLGKSYMELVDDWNYWDIDSSIANIHISIDNYASGHTFLAKKAIQLYMDEIMQTTGNRSILNMHWQRIYNGYASLRFVGTRFKLGMPIMYLCYKFRHKHAL